MRKLKYTLLLFIVILFFGCSEDKGNYDYKQINDVTISEIEKRIPIVVGNNLIIEPKLERKIDSLAGGLEFSWTVNGKEIATTRNLNYQVPNEIGFGVQSCRYIVHDTKNGMRYYKTFEIEVLNPFNWGYYFLTEKPDNSTELAFFSVLNKNTDFVYATGVGDYKFGNNPMFITGDSGTVKINGKTAYCFNFTVFTKEGEYPVISSETATFYPKSVVSEANFLDNQAGYKFSPDAIVTTMRDETFFTSNGQLIKYKASFLYRPSLHNKSYKWSHPIPHASGNYIVFAFDNISNKYYALKPEITNVDLGIFTDPHAYDRVVSIADFPSIEGHHILATDQGKPYSSPVKPTIITLKDGLVHFINFMYSSDQVGKPEFEVGKVLSHETLFIKGATENTILVGGEKDWFVSAENSVSIVPKEKISEMREFVKIPAELGVITSIQLSVSKTKLIVSTYNESSDTDRKGSVVFVDSSSGEILNTYKNVMHKCVSTLSANFYYKYGKDE